MIYSCVAIRKISKPNTRKNDRSSLIGIPRIRPTWIPAPPNNPNLMVPAYVSASRRGGAGGTEQVSADSDGEKSLLDQRVGQANQRRQFDVRLNGRLAFGSHQYR